MTDLLHPKSKTRRDMLRAVRRCINGPVDPTNRRGTIEHGPVVRGGKCQRCLDVHTKKNARSA
jgi:hypothetical protein